MSPTPKLTIIIVGSGLAGLTAARILREHHNVSVYERGNDRIATGGQGIIIASNAVKILESIGYERARAGAVPIRGIRTYSKDGTALEDVNLDLKSRFGADSYAQKRSDFRDELLRLATAPSADLGIEGDPAKIVFDNGIVDVEPDEGIVTLNDGSKVTGDIVISPWFGSSRLSSNFPNENIVADGVHSRLRQKVTGDSNLTAKKTGLTCYRVAVSTEDAKKTLGRKPLPHWWEPSTCQNRSSIIVAGDGSGRVVTAYPICNQDLFNLSCIIKTPESIESPHQSWHADGDLGNMLEIFADFDERLYLSLSAATEVKVWELQDLETLPTWVRGRAILIGDAAHAMTPMQGQGANMSIEDAESFRLLIPGMARDDVPSVLKRIGEVRRERVNTILGETRKVHNTLGLAERVTLNADLYYGYNGIWNALETSEDLSVLMRGYRTQLGAVA